MRRWWGIGAAILIVLAVGVVGALLVVDAQQAPPPAAPLPTPIAATAPPGTERVALPPPPGVERAAPSRLGTQVATPTPDDRRLMNYSVDDVLKVSRAECLQSWVNTVAVPVEVVFDVVLSDGRVMDIGMRTLGAPLPQEVSSCVADKAWLAEWPEWDLPGELRLQRAISIEPRP